MLELVFSSYFSRKLCSLSQNTYFEQKCCNWSKVSFSVEDCKIHYKGTKLAKAKELQPELINFAQFGEKFSNSRF